MPEQLLNVLKLCLLVLLYLFFVRVARAVWVEVNGPRLRAPRGSGARRGAAVAGVATVPVGVGTNDERRAKLDKASRAAKAPKASKAAKGSKASRSGRGRAALQPALVVVAPPEQSGRRYDLSDELTMGRAAGCRITLDDTYVSQLHARVFVRDGSYYVEDLGSTNGTYLNRRKVSGPLLVKPGDQVQVGSTVLELVA